MSKQKSAGDIRRISKFMSLVLRHKPETIGLNMDAQGWVKVDELLAKMPRRGYHVSRELLEKVVAENDKKRFAFSEDGTRIRASQGHSVKIDLGLQAAEPPEWLYHGTAGRNLSGIFAEGLKPGTRQHVHLSLDRETAVNVGGRHGSPVVLKVQSGEMHRKGFPFFISANGVWLTDRVPVEFLIQE